MNEINTKSIRYPLSTDLQLEKIAVKLGRTKKTAVIQMIAYFYSCKKDPLDLNDELLKKELVNGNNRIIAFLKTQERDFLQPLFSDSATLLALVKQHSQYFKEVDKQLHAGLENAERFEQELKTITREISRTYQQLEEKVQLKFSFSKLLEYYIAQRETLGWTSSNVKKEELQAHVRQSLKHL